MIGCDIGYYSSFLDDAAARTLWPDLDMVTAGWVLPAGTARRVDGGYLVDGRWSFGSGCTHADVIVGGCVVHDTTATSRSARTDTCHPHHRCPRRAVRDPRHLVHHRPRRQRQQRLHVPTALRPRGAHVRARRSRPPRRPLYRFPGAFTTKFHGTVLGLARRALDEVTAIADTKIVMPQMSPDARRATRPAELADAETRTAPPAPTATPRSRRCGTLLCDGAAQRRRTRRHAHVPRATRPAWPARSPCRWCSSPAPKRSTPRASSTSSCATP